MIGRNTAFTYKGKTVDLKRIGRELGVRYVLEGSVQRSGNRMRINVQLIDTETGNHLWAERFDKPVADLFDMQDEIISRLAGYFKRATGCGGGAASRKNASSQFAGSLFPGMACANKGWTPEHIDKGTGLFCARLGTRPRQY